MEARGGVLDACRAVLEALGYVLEASWRFFKAFWKVLKSSWKPCWAKTAPNKPRKATTLKYARKNKVFCSGGGALMPSSERCPSARKA